MPFDVFGRSVDNCTLRFMIAKQSRILVRMHVVPKSVNVLILCPTLLVTADAFVADCDSYVSNVLQIGHHVRIMLVGHTRCTLTAAHKMLMGLLLAGEAHH